MNLLLQKEAQAELHRRKSKKVKKKKHLQHSPASAATVIDVNGAGGGRIGAVGATATGVDSDGVAEAVHRQRCGTLECLVLECGANDSLLHVRALERDGVFAVKDVITRETAAGLAKALDGAIEEAERWRFERIHHWETSQQFQG